MIGMSSLTGYTRLHCGQRSPAPSFTTSIGTLQTGQARSSSRSGWIGMGASLAQRPAGPVAPPDPAWSLSVLASPCAAHALTSGGTCPPFTCRSSLPPASLTGGRDACAVRDEGERPRTPRVRGGAHLRRHPGAPDRHEAGGVLPVAKPRG